MLIGAIDCYNFIPLSVTLTLARGYEVSTKQHLLVLFSSTLWNYMGINLIMLIKVAETEYPETVFE